jgi:hypothetical protein
MLADCGPLAARPPVNVALGGCRLIITIAPRMKQTPETINITACRLFFLPMYFNSLS